jgi:succinylglutamate desuccinylase
MPFDNIFMKFRGRLKFKIAISQFDWLSFEVLMFRLHIFVIYCGIHGSEISPFFILLTFFMECNENSVVEFMNIGLIFSS